MLSTAPATRSAHGPSSFCIPYAPLLLVVLNAFNSSKVLAFRRSASPCSVAAAAKRRDVAVAAPRHSSCRATAIALVLGTMAAFASSDTNSSAEHREPAVVVPIPLPASYRQSRSTPRPRCGRHAGLATVIVGHDHILHRGRVQHNSGPTGSLGTNLDDAISRSRRIVVADVPYKTITFR